MDRIPEPELMTDPEQARAYAAADFSEPHDHFIELFREHFPGRDINGLVLDLGCGPADISIRFARAYPGCRVLGVDGARAMLDKGMRAVAAAGLADRVQLMEGYLPGAVLPEVDYAAVISNSLLHHMRDPADFWQTVAAAAGPETPVCVMDLMRPAGLAEAEVLVATHAADAPAVLETGFLPFAAGGLPPGGSPGPADGGRAGAFECSSHQRSALAGCRTAVSMHYNGAHIMGYAPDLCLIFQALAYKFLNFSTFVIGGSWHAICTITIPN